MLYARHGINNVGVDRVIADSGVAKATLYRHFPCKDDLVLASSRGSTPTGPPGSVRSWTAEVRDPGHRIHHAVWTFKRDFRDYLEDLLVDAGRARADELADQLLLLVDGAVVRAAMEGGVGSAQAAKAAARAVLREVEPTEPIPRRPRDERGQ